jgi:hypothetical protein
LSKKSKAQAVEAEEEVTTPTPDTSSAEPQEKKVEDNLIVTDSEVVPPDVDPAPEKTPVVDETPPPSEQPDPEPPVVDSPPQVVLPTLQPPPPEPPKPPSVEPSTKEVIPPKAEITSIEKPMADLAITDRLTVEMRGVPGKGGSSSRTVEELILIQLTNPAAEIKVTVNYQRPFMRLLKILPGIKKIPHISQAQRLQAIRKFAVANKIPIVI